MTPTTTTLTVGEVAARLAAWTHPERAAAGDAVGLQVGDPAWPVARLAVVHEVTEALVERLESEPVDLVVSYHPLLFRPTTRFVIGRNPSGRAARLMAQGIAVLVTHSDFDAMPGGMSDAMADALGLSDVSGFAPVAAAEQVKVVTFAPKAAVGSLVAALSAAGAGRIGDYEQCAFTVDGTGRFVAGSGTNPVAGRPGRANQEREVRIEMVAPRGRADDVVTALLAEHPYEQPAYDVYPVVANQAVGGRVGTFNGSWDELVDVVVKELRPDGLRLAPLPGVSPRRVAVSPGAGGSRIVAAAAAGCDVLVSGDISHHRMVEANDLGLSVVDPGHAATERPGMTRLHDLVRDLVGDDAKVG